MEQPSERTIDRNVAALTQQLAPQPDTSSSQSAKPKPSNRNIDDLPGEPLTVTLVDTVDELREHLPAWERLVEKAAEPNIFYEPWMLIPGWEKYGKESHVQVALIYGPCRKNPKSAPVLCGLLPLERHRTLGGLPIGNLQAYRYIHCFLRTPLVRDDCIEETLAALFDWFRDDPQGAAVLRLDSQTGDGPIHRALIDLIHRRGLATWLRERHNRAMLVPANDAESYSQIATCRKRRHEIRRLRKRLAEQGELQSITLEDDGDIDRWIDEFLRLESKGWKGRNASAFACSEADRAFFRSIAHDAFRRRRLMMMGLQFNGEMIALKCNFLGGNGGFAFKIAYDEAFQQYSPGVLLEMDNIAAVHERTLLKWMDSCADPDHPMIDRLWGERRTIESLWVSTGRRFGNFAVTTAPPIRWLRDTIARG